MRQIHLTAVIVTVLSASVVYGIQGCGVFDVGCEGRKTCNTSTTPRPMSASSTTVGAGGTNSTGGGGESGTGGMGGAGGGIDTYSCVPSESANPVRDECGVFVRKNGGKSGWDGTKENPAGNLMDAFEKATQLGRDHIYVCSETFDNLVASIIVPEGFKVYGGLDCNKDWTWTNDGKTTLKADANVSPLVVDSGAMKLPTTIDHFRIEAAPATINGGSSIAVLINIGALADFTECEIIAASGVAGQKGDDGAEADVDPKFAPSTGGSNPCTALVSGSGGGNCMSSGGNGGLGAAYLDLSMLGSNGGSGTPQKSDPLNWADGAGGMPTFNGCAPGHNGANGANGLDGSGASEFGTIVPNGKTPIFTNAAGKNGGDGEVAQGGGGGSGGYGGKYSNGDPATGGSGGGGGAGGCGGKAGSGGKGGGSSIGILSMGSNLSLKAVQIHTSLGGQGGGGGTGKMGEPGHSGSSGGTKDCNPPTPALTTPAVGCNGGSGGKGGSGGSGGGGRGGHSIGIVYIDNGNGTPLKMDAGTSITVDMPGKGGARNDFDPNKGSDGESATTWKL